MQDVVGEDAFFHHSRIVQRTPVIVIIVVVHVVILLKQLRVIKILVLTNQETIIWHHGHILIIIEIVQ